MKGVKCSLDQVFLVFVHVALQDVFHGAQQALEGIALDVDNSAISHCFDAGLTNCVFHQGYLTEVVSIMVLKHLLGFRGKCLSFLCQEFAFSNDVKTIALVSLLDDVGSSFVLLLLEGITKLLFLVWVDFSEDFHF